MSIMEIEIESKRNNPLLNRTEVTFTVKHEGEKTPNREIIRSELADKLNTKKENIIVSSISSSFGVQKTTGYAKVYSSLKNTKGLERNHILARNKLVDEKKKEEKPKDEKPAEATAAPAEPAAAEPEVTPESLAETEQPSEEKPVEPETPAEEPKAEKPTEEPAEETKKPEENKE